MQMVSVVELRTTLSFVGAWFLDDERSQRHPLRCSVVEWREQGSGGTGRKDLSTLRPL